MKNKHFWTLVITTVFTILFGLLGEEYIFVTIPCFFAYIIASANFFYKESSKGAFANGDQGNTTEWFDKKISLGWKFFVAILKFGSLIFLVLLFVVTFFPEYFHPDSSLGLGIFLIYIVPTVVVPVFVLMIGAKLYLNFVRKKALAKPLENQEQIKTANTNIGRSLLIHSTLVLVAMGLMSMVFISYSEYVPNEFDWTGDEMYLEADESIYADFFYSEALSEKILIFGLVLLYSGTIQFLTVSVLLMVIRVRNRLLKNK